MPVYHFTWHAHGTWTPDNPRGYVERDRGILPPDPEKADLRERISKNPIVNFDRPMSEVLITGAADICEHRGWKLHAAGTDPTHLHFLVSWTDETDWETVQNRMKNVLSLFLGRLKHRKGGKWFVGNGSHKRVRDQTHFDHLVGEYFPSHQGVFWKIGMALPEIDRRILDGDAA